ncbi:MAG: hypothetical protein R2802_03845 [Flavobacteriaceae bacterium]|nr:hypothetical protein [Mangrovimonas sp.]MCB0433766.1 hypothetical protein [Mangrovimonas sp.]MCB0438534.1 hypothetical protein [Mangrovimonas sp.]HPF95887.1 hypothetical protein [Mangrovimonas sp.]
MKLLLITAIQEFENDVKNILNHSGVKAFSYQEVRGYKNESDGNLDNWFVSSRPEFNSLLFTVFIECECVEDIYKRVEKFNAKQESLSHIHVAALQIEKSL